MYLFLVRYKYVTGEGEHRRTQGVMAESHEAVCNRFTEYATESSAEIISVQLVCQVNAIIHPVEII